MAKDITEGLHAKVCKTLENNTIKATAKIHHISEKTVSRIRKGGSTYAGYLLELSNENLSRSATTYNVAQDTTVRNNPHRLSLTYRVKYFLIQMGKALWDESESEKR